MTQLEVDRALRWLQRQADNQIVGDYARTILALLASHELAPAVQPGEGDEG